MMASQASRLDTAVRRQEFWRSAYAFWKREWANTSDPEAQAAMAQAFHALERQERQVFNLRSAINGKST